MHQEVELMRNIDVVCTRVKAVFLTALSATIVFSKTMVQMLQTNERAFGVLTTWPGWLIDTGTCFASRTKPPILLTFQAPFDIHL